MSIYFIYISYNENKPVTASRDTQEIHPSAGAEMLKIFSEYPYETSILDDFKFYEHKQETITDVKVKSNNQSYVNSINNQSNFNETKNQSNSLVDADQSNEDYDQEQDLFNLHENMKNFNINNIQSDDLSKSEFKKNEKVNVQISYRYIYCRNGND